MQSAFLHGSWHGQPRQICRWWALHKRTGTDRAACGIFTHPDGFELRLEVNGQAVKSAVCASPVEMVNLSLEWRLQLESDSSWERVRESDAVN